MYCFNWVAALGHRGGQEFGPLLLWPPHSYSIFLCEATLLYFFVFYNSVLFYDLFVSSMLGGLEVAVGRTDWAGGEMHCRRYMCYFSCFVWRNFFFCYYLITSNFFFSSALPFIRMGHFFPSFNPSLLPSCSSVPLQGGRQVTAVGGRRACHVLLCLGLHQNIPPQVTLATFPFNHPTVVWRKWQLFPPLASILQWLPERSLWLLISLLWVWFMISSLIWAGWCLYLTSRRAKINSYLIGHLAIYLPGDGCQNAIRWSRS